MMHEIWWSLPLTLIVFFLARKLAARFKFRCSTRCWWRWW
ncbi:LrgA-associated membrane protein LrgB [Klebsiella pneumoniae]|uniref:LrgA-associated membrane protein LrgB n=1 Tax=Klebsiella pneumoniae TaxID=573 RepID=A0A378FY98_KLEPN|nr:LrgA-associated membrane protein LrgB [Klebsiella pneumoniae]